MPRPMRGAAAARKGALLCGEAPQPDGLIVAAGECVAASRRAGHAGHLLGVAREYLDLFTAARLAQLMFFYQGMALKFPQHRDESSREINHSAKYLKRILKKMQ